MHHKILERFYLISICLLPLFILSGPFIPDLIISIAAIVFLLFNSNYIYNNFNRFLFVFFSYFIYLIFSSLFSQDLYSIVHTTVHIRFFVLYFIFDYLIKNYKNIFLNLFLISIFSSLLIIILIFVYDILSGNINLDISNVAFDYQYSGIFSEEKKLGSIIFFYLSLFLSLIIKFKKTSYTRFILTLFFISILSLIVYFTAERKTILLLVIFLFFYIFLIINNKKSKIILVLISVIIDRKSNV